MIEFFKEMSNIEQIYWITALVGSFIFLLIFLLTFIGGDIDSDMDADLSELEADDGGVGFQFFTFKNVVAFFTIFGWTGVTSLDYNLSSGTTLIISIIAGLIMMVITSLLFFWINKLAESGTLQIKNAIGQVGEVYLPIGANRSGIGKISIKVQGSLRELEAITDDEIGLPTKTIIEVIEVISDELLLVKKLNK